MYAHHFTGTRLNSLGRQKLSAMIGGREIGKIEVFMAMSKDGEYTARQNDVMAFLQSRGMRDNMFVISDGPNPNLGTPAAQGLNGLAKQQGTGAG